MMLIDRLYGEFRKSSGISIDTRTLQEGEMYFALSGENFNGNDFAQDAIDKGADCVVVSDQTFTGVNVIHVENCLVALQELASIHRSKLDIPVIAITGSNGKTTTKELIHQVLSKKFRTISTKGNLNNHIGVPLSLLSISSQDEIAIIEIGANHIGEVESLCRLSKPTHGLITNIGKAHLEGFGSVEGVKKAKSELYESLRISNGVVFVNVNEAYLEDLSANIAAKVKYVVEFPSERPDVEYMFSQEASREGVCVALHTPSGDRHLFESNLYGAYNVPNIATAVTVGLYFKVEPDDITAAIDSYIPANNRSQLVHKAGKTILLDAYNANPVSMELAITDLARKNGAKSLILGGMNELGDYSMREHMRLLELVSRFEWGAVLLIGHHFSDVKQSFDFLWFVDAEECKRHLGINMLPDGYVLLKGSRSLQLESLLDYIK